MGRGLRRFTGILLTLSISLSLSAPVMAVDTGFTDVAPNAWYCAYVDYAAEEGLFKGATPTGFEPDRAITRD